MNPAIIISAVFGVLFFVQNLLITAVITHQIEVSMYGHTLYQALNDACVKRGGTGDFTITFKGATSTTASLDCAPKKPCVASDDWSCVDTAGAPYQSYSFRLHPDQDDDAWWNTVHWIANDLHP